MTAWLNSADGPREVTVRLRRDRGLRGIVLRPDGSPAGGATLGIALPNRTLRLNGPRDRASRRTSAERPGDRWRQPVTVQADGDGRFLLPTESDPSALLVVVHEAGYLERPFREVAGDGARADLDRRLQLAPWGRIAGRAAWGEHPGADERIEMIVSRESLYPDMVGTISTTRSDARGRFEFKDIPPGRVQVSHIVAAPDEGGLASYQFPVMHVDVRAGEPTELELGAPGRAVAGRLVGLDSYKGVTLRVHPRAPHIGFAGGDAEWRGWSAMRNSPLGPIAFRDTIPVGEDGRFLIEGLVPESYQLFVNGGVRPLRGYASFTVRSTVDGDALQDLGEVRVRQGAD